MRTTPRIDRESARTDHDGETIARFWRELSPADRELLSRPRERRREALSRVGAYFDDEGATDPDNVDLYEYLVNHEVYLVDGRRFHICTAHAEARATLARGVIDARFACPLANVACPMTTLTRAAEGRHVRLRLVPTPRCEERSIG